MKDAKQNKGKGRRNKLLQPPGNLALPAIIAVAMAVGLFLYQPFAGVFGIIGAVLIGFFTYHLWKDHRDQALDALENLNDDFDEITKHAIFDMPFPMTILDGEGKFLWHNSIFKEVFDLEDSILGESYESVFDNSSLPALLKGDQAYFELTVGDKPFQFFYNIAKGKEGRLVLLYGLDNSEYEKLSQKFEDEQTVVALVYFDNYEEVRSRTSEWDRSLVFARVDGRVHRYAAQHNALYIKYESDRYLLVMTQEELEKAKKDKFSLLEKVKEEAEETPIAPTLSIGISYAEEKPADLLKVAHQAMDIALSRGGDQVVIKKGEKLSYYGGQSQATQRYTKVKARVMANTIRTMIQESSNVLVMGHQNPDMDSYGSCLGMLTLVEALGREGWFVLDDLTPAIKNLHEMATKELAGLEDKIISPSTAENKLNPGSLIIVLDNFRHDSTAAPEILDHDNRIVIIDHHRRGADYISQAELAYIEPYASSTSELVTELYNYMGDIEMPPAVAEGLLSGITVDTKNFFYQTGTRTFESAAYLKQFGADSMVIKNLFKDALSLTKWRSEIIAKAEPFDYNTIIGYFDQEVEGASLIASEAADELLNIKGMDASFVLAQLEDKVHISARSLGQVSVQLIMESLGGGGHLTASATQLDMTMEEAEAALKAAIRDYFEEEEDMKVILLQNVDKLGMSGDLVDVKPGYFNNYLGPRQLAIKASPEAMKNWKIIQKNRKKVEAKNREEAQEIKEKLEEIEVEIKAKSGDQGRLFGSVTSQDIADALKKDFGIDIDKKKLDMAEPIKELGDQTIPVKVYPEIQADLKVKVSEDE